MSMMGVGSVDYHEQTVAGRADDPVMAAAAYYASRGETPMTWGGQGCPLLGLDGEVDLGDYRAIFGAGGAHDPRTGIRLVGCRRPGLEVVVSPHKSVAELGVIGRAEHMHAICDVERDATLDYLDRVVSEIGGRRGRAQVATSTGGLIWATSRHATTRAGDPQVHDHVLIANAVLMGDSRGGWKALDTAFVRDHLHAATAVGRLAAAAKAVELGYGIVPDGGPSGRLGGWAIGGIPAEVCEAHSKRAAQIDAAVGTDGSYAARSVAARATRDRKAEQPLRDLMLRWQTELIALGYPPVALEAAVDTAGAAYWPRTLDLDELAAELLAPGGRLASEKTFARGDVIVAVAPHLHGLPMAFLDQAVEAVLAHSEAVGLPAVCGSREPVWAARCVLADEERIAELAKVLAGRAGAEVHWSTACDAIEALQARLGRPLTDIQRQVAMGLMTGGHRLDLIVGIAGSGKTTTLSAVRAGFETAGYTVLGTATSGQAAKTLGDGAEMESRTIASLTWRLEHGTLALSDRHVIICDETGMTTDVDVARLLGAVERAGAKMIVVGDDRQLDAVGPGGSLTALIDRHPQHVWTLTDNLRQTLPAECAALAELRDGNVAAAVDWYAQAGRVHPVPNQRHAVGAMVKAWAADIAAGQETLMLAYRRDNVEALNLTARRLYETAGLLSGPELTAPGGRRYRAGDRIITLAPGPQGAWVTSQAAQVTAVDPHTQQLTAVTPDGQQLRMGPDDIAAEQLGYGYAITAHRSQGSTVDIAHVLDDGGGRELAYVAMSRARTASHVYVTASDPRQAAERLAWAWDQQRRQEWITERAEDVPSVQRDIADLTCERDRLARLIPPDVTDQVARVRDQIAQVESDRDDLHAAAGRWADTRVGHAHQALQDIVRSHDQDILRAQDRYLGLWARHRARQTEQAGAIAVTEANRAWHETVRPHDKELGTQLDRLGNETRQLDAAQQARSDFLGAYPGVLVRISELDHAITHGQDQLRSGQSRPAVQRETPAPRPSVRHDPHLDHIHHQHITQAAQAPRIGGPAL
jgi:conjugative relaxase-like TrwC/TraI family protein